MGRVDLRDLRDWDGRNMKNGQDCGGIGGMSLYLEDLAAGFAPSEGWLVAE
jgi:hypothetical protein